MKRSLPLLIALLLFAAMVLCARLLPRRQKPVSYDGATLVLTDDVQKGCVK